MLHVHFGAGRLGLGLVAPFFQKPGSELYLLNRAVSAAGPTGATGLTPERRNQLLLDHPRRQYFIQKPGGSPADRQVVHYDGFFPYEENQVTEIIRCITHRSAPKGAGVIITASILSAPSYGPVLDALNILSQMKEDGDGSIGRIYLLACENTLDAHDVFQEESLRARITPATRRHVTCVSALVDRLCVGMEEDPSPPHPALQVRAEEYGSLKLKLDRETEPLVDLLRESRIEFSRHLEVEKKIKSWLVNGTQWLIALTAFEAGGGCPDLKLNDYLNAAPDNSRFAHAALTEMCEGIAALLRSESEYAAFVADVDIDDYLEGARRVVLDRFASTEDPIARILARFRAPTSGEFSTIEAFVQRFSSRVDPPMQAYEHARGFPPPTASQGILKLFRLIAGQQFVNTAGQG